AGGQDFGIAVEHDVAGIGEAQLPCVDLGALCGQEHDRTDQVVGHHGHEQFLFHHVGGLHRDPLQADRLFQTAQVGFDVPATAIQLHYLLRRPGQRREQVQPLFVSPATHTPYDQASFHTGTLRPTSLPFAVPPTGPPTDRKSTRLNSSHITISYAVFCLKKKKNKSRTTQQCHTTHKNHKH